MNDERILAAVESKRDRGARHAPLRPRAPELSHEEYECSRYIVDMLEQAGLEVDRGVAGMKTAFRATLTWRAARAGRSGSSPSTTRSPSSGRTGTIEPVHSCGHDAIPARRGRDRARARRPARRAARPLVVFGCPADEIPAPLTVEIGGGKAVVRGRRALGRDRRRALRAPRVRGHGVPAVALDAARPRDRHRDAVARGRARGADRGGARRDRRGKEAAAGGRDRRARRARRRRRGGGRPLRRASTSCSAPTRSPGWTSSPRRCGRRCPTRPGRATRSSAGCARTRR